MAIYYAEAGRGFGIPRLSKNAGDEPQRRAAERHKQTDKKTDKPDRRRKDRKSAGKVPSTARSRSNGRKLSRLESIAHELGVPLTARPAQPYEQSARGTNNRFQPYFTHTRGLTCGRSSPHVMAAADEHELRDLFKYRTSQRHLWSSAPGFAEAQPLFPRSLQPPYSKLKDVTQPTGCGLHFERPHPSPFTQNAERDEWRPVKPSEARKDICNPPRRDWTPRQFIPASDKHLWLGLPTEGNDASIIVWQAKQSGGKSNRVSRVFNF